MKTFLVNLSAFIMVFLFVLGVSIMNTEIVKGLLVMASSAVFFVPVYLDERRKNHEL